MICKNKQGNITCLDRKVEMYDICIHCFSRKKHEEDNAHPSYFPKIFYAEDLLELKYKKEKR